MDKLDLCLIPLVFLLRTAYFILQLVTTSSHRIYDYWFHSSNNVTLRSDFMSWFSYALIQCGLWFIHALYLSIEWIQVFPYCIPIVSTFYAAMVFWPRFYWSILWDPDGRSIREIISNPTNEDQSAHSYLTKKKKKSKIERRLRPSRSRCRFLRRAVENCERSRLLLARRSVEWAVFQLLFMSLLVNCGMS